MIHLWVVNYLFWVVQFFFFFGYYDNVILCYGRFVFIDLSATDLDIPKNQFIQTDIFPKEKVFDRWFSR